MLALFQMTNPLWDFVIGPVAVAGFGWWLRGRLDRIESEEDIQTTT